MNIHIKKQTIEMNLGNDGLLLGVHNPTDDKHIGNLRIGKATITWYKGKPQDPNGNSVSWDELIKFFENKITSK